MSHPTFQQLNDDWNAEGVDPDGQVSVSGSTMRFTFFLGEWGAYTRSEEWETGRLSFENCAMWRRGEPNDEGWFRGQCRYSKVAPIAPGYVAFYELIGVDDHRLDPADWHELAPLTPEHQHFLFYMHDETLECFATAWAFERGPVCPWPEHPSFEREAPTKS